MPTIPKFRRLRQENCQLRAFLGCMVSSYLKTSNLLRRQICYFLPPFPLFWKSQIHLFLIGLYIYSSDSLTELELLYDEMCWSFVVLGFCFVFLFLRQSYYLQLWLAWNLFCWPDWPWTLFHRCWDSRPVPPHHMLVFIVVGSSGHWWISEFWVLFKADN